MFNIALPPGGNTVLVFSTAKRDDPCEHKIQMT